MRRIIGTIQQVFAMLDPPATGRFAPVIQLLAPTVEGVDELREAAGDWLSRRYARWNERVNVIVGREQLRQVERAFLIMKLFVGALVTALIDERSATRATMA